MKKKQMDPIFLLEPTSHIFVQIHVGDVAHDLVRADYEPTQRGGVLISMGLIIWCKGHVLQTVEVFRA